jgi:hypothetical protein
MRDTARDFYHIGLLIALLVSLWFVVSWYFGCDVIPVPYSCDAYWGITRFADGGKARVLIVYGDGGLGDHQLLESVLQSPTSIGARPVSMHIDRVTGGNLRDYDLVIVEEAKQLSTAELKMFMDYVTGGGRLVWTGDAGTALETGDQVLFEFERPGGNDQNAVLSPWARKQGDSVIAFDEFLGVNFIGNFCELKRCAGTPQVGILSAPDRTHDLVRAIRPDLKMFGNFSVVQTRKDAYTNTVLVSDTFSDIISDTDTYGNVFIPETPECSDEIDNDGDGRIDYTGIDTDFDGVPDILPDPGCSSPSDDFEGGAERPGIGGRDPECDDGIDNDGDGKTDFPNDSCCINTYWDSEGSCTNNMTQCSDGEDNDKDGAIDFPADAGCISSADDSEGRRNLGSTFPIIVTTGVGQKIAYYAIPPEFWVSSQMPVNPDTGERYSYMALLQNMYEGMVK